MCFSFLFLFLLLLILISPVWEFLSPWRQSLTQMGDHMMGFLWGTERRGGREVGSGTGTLFVFLQTVQKSPVFFFLTSAFGAAAAEALFLSTDSSAVSVYGGAFCCEMTQLCTSVSCPCNESSLLVVDSSNEVTLTERASIF